MDQKHMHFKSSRHSKTMSDIKKKSLLCFIQSDFKDIVNVFFFFLFPKLKSCVRSSANKSAIKTVLSHLCLTTGCALQNQNISYPQINLFTPFFSPLLLRIISMHVYSAEYALYFCTFPLLSYDWIIRLRT